MLCLVQRQRILNTVTDAVRQGHRIDVSTPYFEGGYWRVSLLEFSGTRRVRPAIVVGNADTLKLARELRNDVCEELMAAERAATKSRKGRTWAAQN